MTAPIVLVAHRLASSVAARLRLGCVPRRRCCHRSRATRRAGHRLGDVNRGRCSLDASIARLPDNIVLPGAAAVLAMAVMADRWATALIGALLLAGPMLIVHLVRPEGFGFGDVKFGLLLGLGLGAVAVRWSSSPTSVPRCFTPGHASRSDAGSGCCPSARRWPSPQRRR